jgi:hypothetical protein
MARPNAPLNALQVGRNLLCFSLGWTILLGGMLAVRDGLNQPQHSQDWVEKLAIIGILLRTEQE